MVQTSSTPLISKTVDPSSDQDLPDPVDREIGRRIFVRRKQVRLTQTVLGAAIGVSFQQVQKYERGSNRVSTSALYRIAAVLDVPMSYFFDVFPPLSPDQRSVLGRRVETHLDFVATDEGQRLVENFLRLPKQLRPKFIAMLDTLNAISTEPHDDTGATCGHRDDLVSDEDIASTRDSSATTASSGSVSTMPTKR